MTEPRGAEGDSYVESRIGDRAEIVAHVYGYEVGGTAETRMVGNITTRLSFYDFSLITFR